MVDVFPSFVTVISKYPETYMNGRNTVGVYSPVTVACG
jgi:hypothetical protein